MREAGTWQECGGRLAPQEHGCWGRRLCRHHSLRHGSAAAGPGEGRSSTAIEAMDVPDLVGGEDAAAGLGLRRRRGFAGDGVYASRCILLLSASWDLRTAVAMAAGSGSLRKIREEGCCLANPSVRGRGTEERGRRGREMEKANARRDETRRTGRGGAGYMDRSGRGGLRCVLGQNLSFFKFH